MTGRLLVPSFTNCLPPHLLPSGHPLPWGLRLSWGLPHPWVRTWPWVLLFQCGANRFGAGPENQSAFQSLKGKSPNVQFWKVLEQFVRSIGRGCLAGFRRRGFGWGGGCLGWGWWGLNRDICYRGRRIWGYWAKWCVSVRKLLFYCSGIRCFDTRRICRCRGITGQPDSTSNTFWCSQIFGMRILCVNVRISLWRFFVKSYGVLCTVWSVRSYVYCGSRYSGNFFHILHGLQNTHSTVSCILSYDNCKIYPHRFFIYAFDKYIFKFKLDIHSFWIQFTTLSYFHQPQSSYH